jgi:hypothetical protein
MFCADQVPIKLAHVGCPDRRIDRAPHSIKKEENVGMYTKQALRGLGVTSASITDAQKKQLDEQGFFIAEDVLLAGDLEIMRAEFDRIHAPRD